MRLFIRFLIDRCVKGIIACRNAGWDTNSVRLREEATLVGGYGFAFVELSWGATPWNERSGDPPLHVAMLVFFPTEGRSLARLRQPR
jgi:hypothetical protein